MNSVNLIEKFQELDWTFRGIKAREGIHGLHSYPAMMAPPVARRLIGELTNRGDTVLDPFCGSGTVLAEAVMLGRNAIGYDINPLALLVAKVKTTPINPESLVAALESVERIAEAIIPEYVVLPEFSNIQFWFKAEVITELARLKSAIEHIQNEDIRRFFNLVFARTVRQVSNTKGKEFKLVRMPPEKLETFNPKVFFTFKMISLECIKLMGDLYNNIENMPILVEIHHHDSRTILPVEGLVDLMLTSPPYGDSRTTVAYGQFSRLALQWLGMWEKDVDREGLGGKPFGYDIGFPLIRQAITKIRNIDEKRSKDVESFYFDLFKCIRNIARIIRLKGYAVFVIANRKVKGVILPNDQIIVEMLNPFGFSHMGTLHREIPNKRMPSRNSPSNVPGETDVTMLNEQIVLFKKDKNI